MRIAEAISYREITPPEDEEPVEPLVPELLLVPAAPVDGDVVVELPDEPMPEVVLERELGAVAVDEPLTDPPAEPIPDAVPEADPVVLQAPNAAAHASARSVLVIADSFEVEDADKRGSAGAHRNCRLHEPPGPAAFSCTLFHVGSDARGASDMSGKLALPRA